MNSKWLWPSIIAVLLIAIWLYLPPGIDPVAVPADSDSIARGEYLVKAGGCISCHEGSEGEGGLSGSAAVESPFGTFYASNITPDPETGIGNWSGEDFIAALRHGRRPDGSFYYPAFPYRAYKGLSEEEILDIAAYLQSQPAISHSVAPHELPAWVGRWQMLGWNLLADWKEPGREMNDDPEIARGEHLVRNLGHCSECHSPRDALGIIQYRDEFKGGEIPDGHVEAIDAEALNSWTEEDLALFFLIGMKQDGEFVGGKMEPVIEHNTSQLTDADREAMAAFFKRGLPASP
ncbi:diacylglycerol kinase [Pseudohongiella nitratireducens]|uniref:Diacylglycerol kinase n=1 Tax=Pseudohongiella nitratireducens TaxID=1768907 RepID=A0A917GM91_9GAMM|nr:cytochrome c [Pseudohongiella nitratireducens]MDF1622144.1 cytochrome c [Pseudohongiella nitratireducens]GGG51082.1 diacylglycerol kinase [Pseudohongiella nitratireducens]